MTVDIPAEFSDFVHRAISSGSFASEADVVGAGLRLLAEREQKLEALRAEILPALESLDRGEGERGTSKRRAVRFTVGSRTRRGLGNNGPCRRARRRRTVTSSGSPSTSRWTVRRRRTGSSIHSTKSSRCSPHTLKWVSSDPTFRPSLRSLFRGQLRHLLSSRRGWHRGRTSPARSAGHPGAVLSMQLDAHGSCERFANPGYSKSRVGRAQRVPRVSVRVRGLALGPPYWLNAHSLFARDAVTTARLFFGQPAEVPSGGRFLLPLHRALAVENRILHSFAANNRMPTIQLDCRRQACDLARQFARARTGRPLWRVWRPLRARNADAGPRRAGRRVRQGPARPGVSGRAGRPAAATTSAGRRRCITPSG